MMANYRNLYRIKLGVVRVHGDVVAGAQLAALHAVVPAGVLLGDGDDDEAALAGDHVFLGGELLGVAALAVVVPLHLLPGPGRDCRTGARSGTTSCRTHRTGRSRVAP